MKDWFCLGDGRWIDLNAVSIFNIRDARPIIFIDGREYRFTVNEPSTAIDVRVTHEKLNELVEKLKSMVGEL